MSQRLQLPDIPEAEPSRVRIAYLFRALPGMAYRSYAGNDGTRCVPYYWPLGMARALTSSRRSFIVLSDVGVLGTSLTL